MEVFEYLWARVLEIPAAFWGVLAGSFFSIYGVSATNKASAQRLRDQFEHERAVKTIEREMALRKEIFLQAAEAIYAAIQDMYRFGNLQLGSDEVTKSYMEKSPAIAKVHIVAGTPTLEALMAISGALNTAFYKLWARRHAVLKVREGVVEIDAAINEARREQDNYLSLMKQFNLNVEVDRRKWEVLDSSFKREMERIEKLRTARAPLAQRFGEEHERLIQESSEVATEVAKFISPLIKAIREELQIPFDFDVYEALQASSMQNQRDALANFLREIRKLNQG